LPIIDFHNHFYPPAYLDAVKRGPSNVGYSEDDDGNPLLHYPGDYNVVVPGHRDIAFRQQVLDDTGVDKQVLTFTSPGTHIEEPRLAATLARMVNDAFAQIIDERGDHFTALATLPLNNVEATLAEFDRVTDELGFAGCMLFSNVAGVALADERYWPLYERASDKGVVLYIHPIDPLGVEAMTEYWLMPLVGFLMDTTLAAAHLVFAGVPERYPDIKWVLGHLGGAVPYLAERFDRGFHAFEECRARIDRPPSEYLKEFYYDTVNFDPRCLELALDFAGPAKILAGSDYPHKIGSLKRMLESIKGLAIGEADRAAILGGNTARLLGLDAL
jgi:aminocarboxymuconate-semialdehyde decarboxylase